MGVHRRLECLVKFLKEMSLKTLVTTCVRVSAEEKESSRAVCKTANQQCVD